MELSDLIFFCVEQMYIIYTSLTYAQEIFLVWNEWKRESENRKTW